MKVQIGKMAQLIIGNDVLFFLYILCTIGKVFLTDICVVYTQRMDKLYRKWKKKIIYCTINTAPQGLQPIPFYTLAKAIIRES